MGLLEIYPCNNLIAKEKMIDIEIIDLFSQKSITYKNVEIVKLHENRYDLLIEYKSDPKSDPVLFWDNLLIDYKSDPNVIWDKIRRYRLAYAEHYKVNDNKISIGILDYNPDDSEKGSRLNLSIEQSVFYDSDAPKDHRICRWWKSPSH
jgi:hypothetical protein